MDFKFSGEEENLRKEIREFANAELPEGWLNLFLEELSRDEDWAFAMSTSKKLAQKGWLTMAWLKQYGGQNASIMKQVVYREEAGYWGIPGVMMGIGGVDWVGPSLMVYGTEDQKRKYLPLIASGEPEGVWCTGYSELEAGSDFANIKTTAIKEGEGYLISGKKVSISAGHRARWGWLAAKTDPSVSKKHQGISIIIVDMKSPGVTVIPTPSFSGLNVNNDVIFDDVRVPAYNLVGEENKGWYQLMTSLSYERSSTIPGSVGEVRRILDELVRYAKGTNLSRDPLVRQRLADRAIELEGLRMFVYRTAWKRSKEVTLVYEPSMDKALADEVRERIAVTGMQMLGAYSQAAPYSKWAKAKGIVQRLYLLFPGLKLAMGTDEIEKNIIAQFGLGLPRGY